MADASDAPPGGAFPPTRYSVVLAAASTDRDERARAYDVLVASYWKPVYKYLRVKWRALGEEAEDLTQEFFLRALEKGFFTSFDPAQARFRTFLRLCLDRFAANQLRATGRLKRGGGATHLSLDFAAAEQELANLAVSDELDAEAFLEREWARSFFEQVVAGLAARCRERGKEVCFHLFQRYDVEPASAEERPTYAELAAETGLPVTQVTNYLHWARREMRRLALERLRELTVSDEELRAEARSLLGIELP